MGGSFLYSDFRLAQTCASSSLRIRPMKFDQIIAPPEYRWTIFCRCNSHAFYEHNSYIWCKRPFNA